MLIWRRFGGKSLGVGQSFGQRLSRLHGGLGGGNRGVVVVATLSFPAFDLVRIEEFGLLLVFVVEEMSGHRWYLQKTKIERFGPVIVVGGPMVGN